VTGGVVTVSVSVTVFGGDVTVTSFVTVLVVVGPVTVRSFVTVRVGPAR
jgi:hypothetical protein